MLKQVFAFFDGNPWCYWLMAGAATTALVAWIAVGLWAESRTGDTGRRSSREGWFILLIFAVLLAWRWPYLLGAHEFNTDESQQLAGAITLTRDPVFWRSVDAATAGPIDIYVLLPVHLLGVPLDFFAARLTGLLLVWAMLVACYVALRTFGGVAVARLAVLPGVLFFSVLTEADLLFYTTEHAPMCLTAISFALLWRAFAAIRADANPAFPLLGGAVVAGLLPWAKLQASPFAAVLGAFALALAFTRPERRWRTAIQVVGACVAPTLLGIAVLAAVGQLDTAWRSYVLQNVTYVQIGLPWPMLFNLLGQHILESANFIALLVVVGIGLATAAATAVTKRRLPPPLFWAGAVLSITGVVVVLAPRRDFPHYFLFLIAPLTIWGGAAIAGAVAQLSSANARRVLAAIFLTTAVAIPLAVRGRQPPPFEIGLLLEDWRHPRSRMAEAILRYARPGDSLALWGWSPMLYVETGLPQAVRDGHVQRQIEGTAQQPYFFFRYLHDLERSAPALFVDVTGPGAPSMSDRQQFGHERYRELEEYVRAHYSLVQEVDYARIYLRNDRAKLTAR